ncbi:hypothetical protein [Streptomyces carpinensis]|uniref:Uncharacterized protein n=1 Tax=Streptomyces carpinensis TaxID=66369 RepID=A0ABV1WD84_9ACTN|nr:hypothetical protein [Streptomyces carpinensis]
MPQAALDRLEYSIVVTFARPAPWVVEKWHVAVEGDRAHIVCVSHVERRTVDAFTSDLAPGYAHDGR